MWRARRSQTARRAARARRAPPASAEQGRAGGGGGSPRSTATVQARGPSRPPAAPGACAPGGRVHIAQRASHCPRILSTSATPGRHRMKRSDLTEKLLDIKREKGWTWKYICEQIGGMSPVLIVGA